MSVRMLSVVPISLVFVMLVGCGGNKVADNSEITTCVEEGKIPHLGRCFDSIKLDDRTIGFKLQSKDGLLEVGKKLDHDWTKQLLVFAYIGEGYSTFAEVNSATTPPPLPLIYMGLATRGEEGTNYIDSISILLHFWKYDDHSANIYDPPNTWFAKGTIRMNGKTYSLPVNMDTVKAAYPEAAASHNKRIDEKNKVRRSLELEEEEEDEFTVTIGDVEVSFHSITRQQAHNMYEEDIAGMLTSLSYEAVNANKKSLGNGN